MLRHPSITYKVEQKLPFYQNEGILFQFILHELLKSARLISRLEEKRETLLFTQLVGNNHTRMASYALSPPLSYRPGSLLKLQHYFSHFHQQFSSIDKNNNSINSSIKMAFQVAEEAFHLYMKNPNHGFSEELILLKSLIKKISLSLSKSISIFVKDENVLFFILHRFKEFEATIGKTFVLPLIKKMFKGGTEEMIHFLKTRFSERGFHHLLNPISEFSQQLSGSDVSS